MRATSGETAAANTDRRWGFIRRIEVTTASANDTTVFESILDPTNTDAYGALALDAAV